jgi:hypothetical protein
MIPGRDDLSIGPDGARQRLDGKANAHDICKGGCGTNGNARNLIVCIDGTSNQFGKKVGVPCFSKRKR